MKAVIEIPVPQSCHDCRLAFIHQPDENEKYGCGYLSIDVTEYDDQRYHKCPLKIAKDGFQ
ncbi:MAG: hypothetical protein FWC64_06925 [Treponema sp.]|nr:hypothetical protein [Treponema sp.]